MAKEKRVEKWPGIKTNGRQNMWSPLNLCIPPLAVSTFLICYGLPLVVPTPSLHPPASHTKGQMAKQQPSPLSSPGSVHFSPATLQLVPPLSRLSWWWWLLFRPRKWTKHGGMVIWISSLFRRRRAFNNRVLVTFPCSDFTCINQWSDATSSSDRLL